MLVRNTPAVDHLIAPDHGVSRDGQPLSYNRAPADDLAPYIGRLYVTKVAAPDNYTVSCSIFNDAACVRIQLAGTWEAKTADGPRHARVASLFFGPHSHRMPIKVTGSFISVGFVLRPGACTVLGAPPPRDSLDRMMSTDASTIPPGPIMHELVPDASPEEWLQIIEGHMRASVERVNGALPDPVTVEFERISLATPDITVAQAANACGVERRKLERVVSRDFGLSPKQVLRRARSLDMASHLRGVADTEEGEEIALRYYDDSHRHRDFMELFDMSPRQFVTTPQPILTLALESRQARRLETLNRISPGQARPWE